MNNKRNQPISGRGEYLSHCKKKQQQQGKKKKRTRTFPARCSVGNERLLLYAFVIVKTKKGRVSNSLECHEAHELKKKCELFLFDFFYRVQFLAI